MQGIRFARIAGIDVYLDWSLLIIFFLVTVSLAGGLFPSWHPDWSPATTWLTALAAALLLLVSVLLHELSHALVGRRYGMQIHRITLFVFGGMAQLENEPERWRAELWMALAGPLTSIVIGVLCLTYAGAALGGGEPVSPVEAQRLLAELPPAQSLLLWLGQVNIVLALFNLVPGFPLDGGRVLRAIVWGATGDLRRATRIASGFGQAFAWLLIGTGFAMILGFRVPYLGGGFVSGVWLAFIGWFLNNAALVSYRQLLTRDALQDVPVSRLMLTRFDTVDPDTPVQSLIDDYALRSDQRAFPVVQDAIFLGLVCLQELRKAWQTRQGLRARDIMKPVRELTTLSPRDDALDAIRILSERDVAQLPVLDGDRLVGFVRREDVLRWLTFHRPSALGARSAETLPR